MCISHLPYGGVKPDFAGKPLYSTRATRSSCIFIACSFLEFFINTFITVTGINGLLYNNLKGLSVNLNQTTEWYLMGLGDEVDLHTVHFHGQTILYRHERQHVADVYELGPGNIQFHRVTPSCNPSPLTIDMQCHANI